MNKVQLNRLQKLHDFVKSHVSPKNFDMSMYRAKADGDGDVKVNEQTVKKHACGTNGCLMGWAPFALTTAFKYSGALPKYGKIDWVRAAEKVFGIDLYDYGDYHNGNENSGEFLWKYLFDSEWASTGKYNSTTLPSKVQKKEALKRLRNVIRNDGKLSPTMVAELKERINI